MNARTILLLSAALCALLCHPSPCGAVPAASSVSRRSASEESSSLLPELVTDLVPESNTVIGTGSDSITEIGNALSRIPRDSSNSAEITDIDSLREAIRNILRRIASREGLSTDELIQIAYHALSRIGWRPQGWMENVHATMNALYPLLGATSDTGQRSRRSPLAVTNLLPSLPGLPGNLSGVLRNTIGVVTNPLGVLQDSMESVQSVISEQLSSAVLALVTTIWNLLVTQVLPVVRSILDWIQSTNTLPPFIANAIRSVDTMADVVTMLNSLRAA